MNNSLNTSKIEATKTTGYKVKGDSTIYPKRRDAVTASWAAGKNHHMNVSKIHDWTDFMGNHYEESSECFEANLEIVERRKARKLLRINREIKKLQAKARRYR